MIELRRVDAPRFVLTFAVRRPREALPDTFKNDLPVLLHTVIEGAETF